MRLRFTFLAALAFAGPLAAAQPGALDPSFGTGGITSGTTNSSSDDLALDYLERVLFVGVAQGTPGSPAGALVGRLRPDGTPDPTFAGTGSRVLAVACTPGARPVERPRGAQEAHGANAYFEAVDVWKGKFAVAAGSSACRRGLVARFLEDGALDPVFGSGGLFQLRPDSFTLGSAFVDVHTNAAGAVTAAGWEVRREGTTAVEYVVVVRLTPSGQLDPAFGSGGVARLLPEADEFYAEASDLHVYPDGRVVVAGRQFVGLDGDDDTIVLRLRADGTVDPSFGTGGLTVLDVGTGEDDEAYAVLEGPDGALYLAGEVETPESVWFYGARLLYNGLRDQAWGSAGVRMIRPRSFADCEANDLALDLSGRLTLGGTCFGFTDPIRITWALVRLTPTGALDPSFGTGGIALPDVPGLYETLAALAVRGDGRLVGAGAVYRDTTSTFVWAVARFLSDVPVAAGPDPERAGGALTVAPNPVAGAAEVRFSLATPVDVTLTLHDALGREVARVAAGPRAAGAHVLPLEVAGLPSGVYLLRLTGGDAVETRRVVVR